MKRDYDKEMEELQKQIITVSDKKEVAQLEGKDYDVELLGREEAKLIEKKAMVYFHKNLERGLRIPKSK